jgi:hypothetical protein
MISSSRSALCPAAARLDVLVLQGGLNQPDRRDPRLLAGLIAAFSSSVKRFAQLGHGFILPVTRRVDAAGGALKRRGARQDPAVDAFGAA